MFQREYAGVYSAADDPGKADVEYAKIRLVFLRPKEAVM